MSFETNFIHPIGTLSFLFSVSQWVAWNLFQMTSDVAHMFQCNRGLRGCFYCDNGWQVKQISCLSLTKVPFTVVPQIECETKFMPPIRNLSFGLVYTETCGTIRCHLKHFWCFPLDLFPSFFSVSQWEASKIFQMTSNATYTFQCNQALPFFCQPVGGMKFVSHVIWWHNENHSLDKCHASYSLSKKKEEKISSWMTDTNLINGPKFF